MSLNVFTEPATEPLDLETDVKPHLRIDIDDDDGYLAILIKAARQHIEEVELSSALITQTLDLTLDTWPATPLKLPRPPLQSITSITYTDIDGNTDTVATTVYTSDAASWPGRLTLKQAQSWPTVELAELAGVNIRFVAGYGDDSEDVPEPIRLAMLLMIGDWYENREDSPIVPGVTGTLSMPFAARQLLVRYKNRNFA